MIFAHKGFLQRTASFFLLILISGLLLSISGVSSDKRVSKDGAGEVLFSRWESLPDSGGEEKVSDKFVVGKIGSFSIRRPETEMFFGGWWEQTEQEFLGILPRDGYGWLEDEAKTALREKLFFNRDTTYDFSTWLSENREQLILNWTEGSADYFTDYFVGMTEEGVQRLGFVRNIEWDYQTALGDRRWQTGISALGAFRETADDAIVWQLRGFAAEESSAGANVGLIYRRAVDETLLGANVFLDYEQYGDNSDDFLRWSYGLELRSAWLDIFANRYEAITDGKLQKDTNEYLYSQIGYDAELRLHAPQFSWVSGGLTYYHWEGEYGDEDDTGLRYNLAFNSFGSGPFWNGLKLEVELDAPEEGDLDWGGRVSYRYNFGAPVAGGRVYAETTFDPREHFFDSVRREYSQRIRESGDGESGSRVKAEVGAGIGYVNLPRRDAEDETFAVTMTVSGETERYETFDLEGTVVYKIFDYPDHLSITASTNDKGTLTLENGGKNWQNTDYDTADTAWWDGRTHYGLAEFNGVLFIAGGGSQRDTWVSTDGATWTQRIGNYRSDRIRSYLLPATPQYGSPLP